MHLLVHELCVVMLLLLTGGEIRLYVCVSLRDRSFIQGLVKSVKLGNTRINNTSIRRDLHEFISLLTSLCTMVR